VSSSLEDVFGPVIYAYTRAQALDDGELVEVDAQTSREAGIKWPVAMTRAVFASCVEVPIDAKGEPVAGQDVRGRLWDVVMMSAFAMRAGGSTSEVTVRLRVRQREGHRNVTLKAVCGPGDEGEPVITIMLPDED